MAKMKIVSGGATCKCTPGSYAWLIIGVIVVALGVWAFVKGLASQLTGGTDWMNIAFWYALGLLIIGIGKVIKCKACPACYGK
jgi:hypothetical protein